MSENKLPEKLNALRKHFSFAQADVAEKLNVPVAEYMNWENGNTICRIDQLKQLADLFYVSLDDLINNKKNIELPDLDRIYESVEIPFQKKAEKEDNPFLSQSIEMLPVEGVLEDTEADIVYSEEPIGNTQKTIDFEPTDVVEVREEKKESKPQEKVTTKKHISPAVYAGAGIGLLLLLILGFFLFRNRTPEQEVINRIGTYNRFVLADTFSMYLDDNGKIVSSGNVPSLTEFENVTQISANADYVLGLKNTGEVVSSGYGDMPDVSEWEKIVYIAAGEKHAVGIDEEGKVLCVGSDTACKVEEWTDVQRVFAGKNLTIGLTKENKLLVAGDMNGSARLEEATGVKEVVIGENDIALVGNDGNVKTYAIRTGSTYNTGAWSDINQAAIGKSFAAGLTNKGTVSVSTLDEDILTEVKKWSGIRYIAAKGDTLIALNNNKKIIGVGNNNHNVYEDLNPSPSASVEPDQQLSTVKNVQFEVATGNLTIKWDTVNNADYYEIKVSTSPETVLKSARNSTSVSTSKLTDGQTYRVTITSCTNDTDEYKNSEPYTTDYVYSSATKQLATPTGLKVTSTDDGWDVSWNKVENADYYIVHVGNIEMNVSNTTASVNGAQLTSGQAYSIDVTAHSNNNKKYTPSEKAVIQDTFLYKTYTVTVKFTGAQSDQFTLQLRKGNYRYDEQFNSYVNVAAGNALASPNETFDVTQNMEINVVVQQSPEQACISSGKYWYGGACHDTPEQAPEPTPQEGGN